MMRILIKYCRKLPKENDETESWLMDAVRCKELAKNFIERQSRVLTFNNTKVDISTREISARQPTLNLLNADKM
jgi:hypothetical protein